MQPLLPRSLREGSNGVQALPGLSKGSTLSLCVPWQWAVPAALQGQSIPGQGWQGPGPSDPPALPPLPPLCAQNTSLHSIIYTVFANDSDTGNASRVSYGIEEVSTEHC